MTKALRLALLLLTLGSPVAAQDTPVVAPSGSRPVLRPDGSYFFNSVPYDRLNLVFEAQIAPRIIVFDTVNKATLQILNVKQPRLNAWQVSVTPMVRLRMFGEPSSPVRTPSYMPKANVQFASLKNLFKRKPGGPEPDEEDITSAPISMWLVDVIPFGHHSNGQDGCLFEAQLQDKVTGKCSGVAAGAINKLNGSFSTNYLEATVHYGRMSRIHSDRSDRNVVAEGDFAPRLEWRIGGGVQLNPKGYLGGSIDDELAPLYGATRILAEGFVAMRRTWIGRLEGSFNLQFLHDVPKPVSPVIARIEASLLPSKWGGAGLFVRAHHGQDYYNLGFVENLNVLQVGFVFQKAPFLGLRQR